jgi:hypothetical protein
MAKSTKKQVPVVVTPPPTVKAVKSKGKVQQPVVEPVVKKVKEDKKTSPSKIKKMIMGDLKSEVDKANKSVKKTYKKQRNNIDKELLLSVIFANSDKTLEFIFETYNKATNKPVSKQGIIQFMTRSRIRKVYNYVLEDFKILHSTDEKSNLVKLFNPYKNKKFFKDWTLSVMKSHHVELFMENEAVLATIKLDRGVCTATLDSVHPKLPSFLSRSLGTVTMSKEDLEDKVGLANLDNKLRAVITDWKNAIRNNLTTKTNEIKTMLKL